MIGFPINIIHQIIGRNKLSILIFHRVHNSSDIRFFDPTIEVFDWQVSLLKRHFNLMTLDEATKRLASNSLPKRAAVITFDDGYQDNYTNALPILQKYNVPATFFVTSDYIGGGCMWNDKIIHSIVNSPKAELVLEDFGLGTATLGEESSRKKLAIDVIGKLKHLDFHERDEKVAIVSSLASGAIPDDLMMSVDQVCKLRDAGMEIGGHTATHPILTKLSDEAAIADIGKGKEILESWLKEPIKTFAYPNGKPNQDYTQVHASAVKKMGFEGAVSTAWGVSDSNSDLYQLPRFTPWDQERWKFYLRLLLNYKNSKYSICE